MVPVTLDQVQREVDAWISQFEEGYWSPLENVARLAEEVGELAREINDCYGPKRKKPGEPPGSIAAELGDVLFVIATIANSLGLSLEDAFTKTMEKYRERDAERWTRKG